MIKFYLHFKLNNYGKIQIDEPIGFSSVDFQLKQEEGRYARDISFAGGEFEFEFCNRLEHELEKLLYYHNYYGFESYVQFIVDFGDGIDDIIGELDFQTAKTDGLTYFKCKIIQDGKQALLKRREDIKVDLMSDKTLDDEPIAPLVPENIFLKAKPIVRISKWKNNDQSAGGTSITRPSQSSIDISTAYTVSEGVNNCNVLQSYEIEDTLSFISNAYALTNGFPNNGLNFTYLEFQTDQTDVKFEFTNILAYSLQSYLNDVFSGTNVLSGSGSVQFVVKIGYDEFDPNMETFVLYERIFGYTSSSPIEYLPSNLSLSVPFIENGKKVWVYIKTNSQATFSTDNVSTLSNYAVTVLMETMETKITSTSIAYNTISPSFRLYDVMKYVTKSISGMNITAPNFQSGGEFYDQRILNGNFLRNIKDKGFKITLKEIRQYLVELNADHENTIYDELFFGLYDDFYKNQEIAFFPSAQFDSMEKAFNPRYTINEFNFKYKQYQSQKENSEENTYDSIHGESQWFLRNKRVENKKDVEVGFYRDAFLLEDNRIKGLEDSVSKANQDDEKISIIDTIEMEESERTQTESSVLQHAYDTTTGYLTLRNDGSFSFELLGISEGSTVKLLTTNNAGDHNVISVGGNILVLQRTSAGSSANSGEFITRFTYYIDSSVANYTLWTDEGFTLIDNLNNGDNYANLRFSKKRNILNYWQKYLATANVYHTDLEVKNTFYKNNPDCETVYEGVQVKEGDSFIPSNPILSPVLYENVVLLCEKEDFFQIQKDTRTKRGYIRFIDNKGTVIKGYPKNMKYVLMDKALTCDLEEKYEAAYMTITNADSIILINNETRLHSINYEIKENSLYIYNENMELMYNPVYWNKVSVNGADPSTVYELKTWLDLL